jgi:exosortase A-associated hydrolase 1
MGEQLIGILSQPAAPKDIGVLIIVGGPQYRIGSHRQFVLLARQLAANGYTAMRFDTRGMGDSTGDAQGFERITPDIGSAVDAMLKRVPCLQSVVLWGLCDGASAALLYMSERQDSRIAGLCLVNPWVRSAATLARTHVKHYYLQRLGQREFWNKLMRGKVAGKALRDLADNFYRASAAGSEKADAPFTDRMAAALSSFSGAVLLVLSQDDLTAREFNERAISDIKWRNVLKQDNIETLDVVGADHTFSSATMAEHLGSECVAWLNRRLPSDERGFIVPTAAQRPNAVT